MVFFHMNLFLIGLFFDLNWYYAVKHNFIDESIDQEFIESRKKINLTLPICTLIATGLAFITPEYSSSLFCHSLLKGYIFNYVIK